MQKKSLLHFRETTDDLGWAFSASCHQFHRWRLFAGADFAVDSAAAYFSAGNWSLHHSWIDFLQHLKKDNLYVKPVFFFKYKDSIRNSGGYALSKT